LLLSIDASFVDLDDHTVDTIETVNPVSLMIDDVTSFVKTASLSVVDNFQLFRGQVLEQFMAVS
jgi:hypothetical protein